MKFITNKKELIGMDATLTDAQKDKIVSDTLNEADNRYVLSTGTIILDGNGTSSLIEEKIAVATSQASLIEALADETVTNITLAADIPLESSLVIKERSLTLDLAGHKLENTVDLWSDESWSILSVSNATLVLEDSGDTGIVKAKENDCYTIDIDEGGTVYINGGTYNSNISAVYLYGDNASCYIAGGIFKIQQLNTNGVESPYGLMINIYNPNRDSVRCIITGGIFEGFNPAEPEEGGIQYLPEGYTTQYDPANNTYTVVKED